MQEKHVPLDDLHIASPCTASWEEMEGTERVRFCRHCALNVYNLSALSRRQAERFVRERDGVTCVRFYRRADGTMLTADGPVGRRVLRRAARRSWGLLIGALASILGLFAGAAVYSTGDSPRDRPLRRLEPLATLLEWLDPPQPSSPTPPPPMTECFMGR